MGSSASSEQPPVKQNRQSNGNEFRNIDQSTGAAWLQFNWASFGGGISTIIIICALLVALWIALKYNRKANKKARRAELHKLLLLSSRHQRNHDYHREHSSSNSHPSSGYPGMSSVIAPPIPVRKRGYKGYPGFLAWQQLQHQAQCLQFPTVSSGLPSGLPSTIPSVHQPADWSRIREIPGTPARTRVSYADIHEHQRCQPRNTAPSVSNPISGAPAAELTNLFEPQSRGLAYPPDAVSAIVERLDTITPQ